MINQIKKLKYKNAFSVQQNAAKYHSKHGFNPYDAIDCLKSLRLFVLKQMTHRKLMFGLCEINSGLPKWFLDLRYKMRKLSDIFIYYQNPSHRYFLINPRPLTISLIDKTIMNLECNLGLITF